MSAKPLVLKGVARNGVIVFDAPYPLPDGTEVEFTVTRHVFTPEEAAEFEGWERLGDEAWAMILQWEAEEATPGEFSQPPENRCSN
jgi:hypothetical protein